MTQVPDGYLRLTFTDFCALTIQCHMVWQDSDLLVELREQGITAATAGYCEWVSSRFQPPVSLGWAWFSISPQSGAMLAPGGINCNVMLCADSGADLGAGKTADMLLCWLSSQAWQKNIVVRH